MHAWSRFGSAARRHRHSFVLPEAPKQHTLLALQESNMAVKNPINLRACFARVPRFWDFHCHAMPCPKKIRLREDLEGISTQTSTNHNASQYVSPITWGFPRHPKRKVPGWTSAGINWLPAPKYHFATAKRPLLTTTAQQSIYLLAVPFVRKCSPHLKHCSFMPFHSAKR